MAAIVPLASTEITSDSTYESGATLLYTSTGNMLASVIVTNTAATDGEVYVFINTTSFADAPQLTYRLPLTSYNSYETFRFAMDLGDELYVAGTAGLVFYAQGVSQTV